MAWKPSVISLLASLLAATSLAAGAPAAAAPTPAPSEFYGANVQTLLREGLAPPSQWPTYLKTMSATGLTVARMDAPWTWAQPNNASQPYDWSKFDQVAVALTSQGIRWLPVLDLPPGWAGGKGTAMTPANYAGFAAFARAFATRYGPGGAFWAEHPELPALPPQTYEVWSEANSANFWTPSKQDPAEYLGVFKLVRDAVKASDPTASLLLTLGWQDFANYVNGLYAAGAKGLADGIGFHPYAPTPGGVISMTKKLRDVLADKGEPDLPIEMMEIGWPKAATGPGAPTPFDGPVSDRARAAMLALTGDALAASDCDVKSYMVYSLAEAERVPRNNEDWFGILTRDGAPTDSLDALAGATARWKRAGSVLRAAKPAPLLPLCHGAADPQQVPGTQPMDPPGLLPLRLSVPNTPSACFDASVDYYGDPMPEVSVFVRDYRARQTGVTSLTDGTGQFCMDPQARRNAFLAWSRLGSMASSPVYYCAQGSCRQVACAKAQLRVGTTRPRWGRLRLSVAVRCAGRTMFAEPVHVDAVDRKGRRRPLRAFFTNARIDRFYVQIDPARERKLRVSFGGDPTFGLRGIVKLVPVRRAAARRR